MVSVSQRVVNRAFAKGFGSTAIYSTVRKAVQKCVLEPPSIDTVVKKMVYAPSFTMTIHNLISTRLGRTPVIRTR